MSESLRIVRVINEDENTPDFVSRVRVGVRLCDLSERIPTADDGSELSGFDQLFEKSNVGAQVFTVALANGLTIFAAPVRLHIGIPRRVFLDDRQLDLKSVNTL